LHKQKGVARVVLLELLLEVRRPFLSKRSINSYLRLEARVGIEPTHKAFAEPCLTTWLPRHKVDAEGKAVRFTRKFFPSLMIWQFFGSARSILRARSFGFDKSRPALCRLTLAASASSSKSSLLAKNAPTLLSPSCFYRLRTQRRLFDFLISWFEFLTGLWSLGAAILCALARIQANSKECLHFAGPDVATDRYCLWNGNDWLKRIQN
jgi:hypothetical protein